MVKFEVALPSDEAAIVWAALNAAIDTARAEPTLAGPSRSELSHAESDPAELSRSELSPTESTPAELTPAEQTPAEHLPAKPPAVKVTTFADRGRQRAALGRPQNPDDSSRNQARLAAA